MKQAFPFKDDYVRHLGMSLREYYAGQALLGLLANSTIDPYNDNHYICLADTAVDLADRLCEALMPEDAA